MKTVITIEDGKVTVEVDDKAPVVVETSRAPLPINNDQRPWPAPNQKLAKVVQSKPQPTKAGAVPRICEICEGPIPTEAHALAKVCSDKCRDEKRRRYQTAKYKKPEAPRAPLPMPKPQEPIKQRTDEEQAEITAMMDEQRRNFSDPWDCGMCRNAGDLCTMHESMTRDGKKPPLGKGMPTV